MTRQMWYTHCVIASLLPLMVTALSVEFGSISLATWMEAPVTSLISLILDPPLPMRDPHCEAGTIMRKVIGGRGMVLGATRLAKSWKKVQKKSSVSPRVIFCQRHLNKQQNYCVVHVSSPACPTHVHRMFALPAQPTSDHTHCSITDFEVGSRWSWRVFLFSIPPLSPLI